MSSFECSSSLQLLQLLPLPLLPLLLNAHGSTDAYESAVGGACHL